MGINHRLIVQSVGIVISIACFNATGVTITKYASASQRSTIDTSRTVLIWAIALMQHQEVFIWGEFIGFIFLVFGTLVYNEILVLPCNLFKRNTRKQLKIRAENEEEGTLDEDHIIKADETHYIGTSPGAAYDHQRNLRALDNKLNDRQKLLSQHNAKDTAAGEDIFYDS